MGSSYLGLDSCNVSAAVTLGRNKLFSEAAKVEVRLDSGNKRCAVKALIFTSRSRGHESPQTTSKICWNSFARNIGGGTGYGRELVG
jgi:hypothetical protein